VPGFDLLLGGTLVILIGRKNATNNSFGPWFYWKPTLRVTGLYGVRALGNFLSGKMRFDRLCVKPGFATVCIQVPAMLHHVRPLSR